MSLDVACVDTICAQSSALGYGAIAIVRASGSKAHEIIAKIFRKTGGELKPLRAMHGQVVDHKGDMVDDCVAIMFPKHSSFTGEDSFEIHCHGNQLIIERLLKVICAQGARLSEPGEFSMRALLNGKIDLAQAESIADLIHAKSNGAIKAALKGVQGGLKARTLAIRETIVSTLAEIEARMDFPDEDLGGYDRSRLLDGLALAHDSLSRLLANSSYALKLHEGARIAICGLPNAGKSTLFNQLVGDERAIVHETAGNTRDVIEAHMELCDVPVTLVDVAGIRSHEDSCAVEKIGIDRALLEFKKAHIVIWLADATLPEPFKDPMIEEHMRDVDVVYVLNKVELLSGQLQPASALAISAKLGLGIDQLRATLHHRLSDGNHEMSETFITRARQRDELMAAATSLNDAKDALSLRVADEVVTAELRQAR